MGDCNNKRLGDKLYAYELGMLADSEREEFEIHLLECSHCQEKAIRFQDAARIMRFDDDVRESVEKICEQEEVPSGQQARTSRKKRKWLALMPVPVAALAVLLILILKPWHIDIQPTDDAVAAQSRVAIMYFDNLADHDDAQRMGEIAANLLITDLSESRYVNVVSSQRLYDILKLLGREGETKIDRFTALEVAKRAGTDRLLTGSVLQVEPQIIITTQLVNVRNGQVESSQRVIGDEGDNIFSVIDKLTVEIKEDLSLPFQARNELDRPVSEVTTDSPDAYRNYLEGLSLYNKFFRVDAAESFERALEFDSTYAMAYYYLSDLQARDLIAKAVEYSENASEKERYFIRSREALYASDFNTAAEELEKAIERYPEDKSAHFELASLRHSLQEYYEGIYHLKEAIRIDPLYKSAYNLLAYAYSYVDSVEQAIQTIDLYASLVPDEPNPHDSKGEILALHGRYDEAIESYKKAIEIKPDFHNSWLRLAELYLRKRMYAEVESCAVVLSNSINERTRADARFYRAIVLMHQGRLEACLKALDKCIEVDILELGRDNWSPISVKNFCKAKIYDGIGESELAVQEVEKIIEAIRSHAPVNRVSYRAYYAEILARDHQFEKARRVLDDLTDFYDETGRGRELVVYSTAFIELCSGEIERAIETFRERLEQGPDFESHFALARALLETGRSAEAVTEFEAIFARPGYWYPCHGVEFGLVHYYAGLAYEGAGMFEDARARYEHFLDIWKDADTTIAEIKDAKLRLSRLESSS